MTKPEQNGQDGTEWVFMKPLQNANLPTQLFYIEYIHQSDLRLWSVTKLTKSDY